MAKVDPKDFLLNTDYEIDKIILVKTGSFVDNTNITHGLDFTPLVFGVWSSNKNFTTTNPLGEPALAEEYGYSPPTGVDCRALNDKIFIKTNGANAGTTTIYYRLYAIAPPEANSNTPTTSKLANQFILNTDYNYRKLKATGSFTQPGQSYQHKLGYLPQVMAWVQYSEIGSPTYDHAIQPILVSSSDYGLIVTTSEIKLPDNFPFSLIDRVIWRVYYDET